MNNYKSDIQPQDCKDIQDIREQIDAIDHQIMKLFGLRFEYVKEVVKFKEKTADSVVAKKRKESVIKKRRSWAVENGLNPDVIEEIYLKLINYFISEEMKFLNIEPNK